MVFVDEIDGAIVEALAVSNVGNAGASVSGPVPEARSVREFAGDMVLGVQILRIEAIPPVTRAGRLGQFSVVRNTGQRAVPVGSLRHFVPHPGVRGVNADTESQAVIPRGARPSADQIFLRADFDGVPRLIFAIEVIEIVVMVGQCAEILRPRPLVQADEFVGVPVLCFPLMDHVLESEFGRMTVMFQVELVIRIAFDVHTAGVPVAVLRLALRTPVSPNPEFGVAVPLWRLILLQRFPRGLEPAPNHRLDLIADRRNELHGGGPSLCVRCQQANGHRFEYLAPTQCHNDHCPSVRSVKKNYHPPMGITSVMQRRSHEVSFVTWSGNPVGGSLRAADVTLSALSLIHISEPTRLGMISY